MRVRLLALLCALAVPLAAPAQDVPPPAPPAAPPKDQQEPDPSSLGALHRLLDAKRADVARKQAELAAEKDPRRITELSTQVSSQRTELERLERSFESLATGVDLDAYWDVDREKVDWQKELLELVKPLLRLIKSATDDPRMMEQWRSELDLQEARVQTAGQALVKLRHRLDAVPAEQARLRQELTEALQRWESQRVDARNHAAAARQFLDARLAERKSIWESTSIFLGGFFRTRGLNLLLAIAAFLAVLAALRSLYRTAQRFGSERRKGFRLRLLAVAYHAFVGVASTAALLAVLYAANDWVLLALAIIVLLGIVWAGKTWLPRFFEELKMMLNIGPVREKERLLWEGLPWLVDSLALQARLVNPRLTGGVLRLPIRDLIGLRSRPHDPREPWFPCQEGDVVQLGDGTRGKVLLQTPEVVELLAGGSKATYKTADFVGMTPKNLSESFVVATTWGIGYAHQAIATTAVPPKMQARVQRELERVAPPGTLLGVKAFFKEAGQSSLDFDVIAELKGEAAAQIGALTRTVQRALLELCNDEGWDIPFQTMTIEMAK